MLWNNLLQMENRRRHRVSSFVLHIFISISQKALDRKNIQSLEGYSRTLRRSLMTGWIGKIDADLHFKEYCTVELVIFRAIIEYELVSEARVS